VFVASLWLAQKPQARTKVLAQALPEGAPPARAEAVAETV
jgi:hypothetical protein